MPRNSHEFRYDIAQVGPKNRRKTALDPNRSFPYLPATTRAAGLSPNRLPCKQHTSVSTSGWVCPGNCKRFLRTSEALSAARMQAARFDYTKARGPFPASYSSTARGLDPRGNSRRRIGWPRPPQRRPYGVHSRATNRSRKRMASFAPLGPDLSGGIFLR